MTIRELHLTAGYAVLAEDRTLTLFRLEDGVALQTWPREPGEDDQEGDDQDGDDQDDDDQDDGSQSEDDGEEDDDRQDDDTSAKVSGFVLDRRLPRLALLWRDHVELLDLASGATKSIDGIAAQCDSLLAIGPDGRLFGEGEATGLAAIHAFADIGNLVAELPPQARPELGGPPFDSRAGRLSFALGFNTLPHVQTLVFSDDGHYALSGTLSQYKAHLAYLNLWGPGEVLHLEPLEVIRIALLPGFVGAVVHEASYAGSKRLSLWKIEERRRMHRVRDLHVEDDASSSMIEDFVLDPNGSRAVIFTSDGRVRSTDFQSGTTTLMQRVGAPLERPLAGTVAIDFARGVLVMRDQTHLAIFDLGTGHQTATLDPVDAIYVQDSQLLAVRDDRVVVVDGERCVELAVAGASIVAAAPGADGLVIVDAEHRVACVKV